MRIKQLIVGMTATVIAISSYVEIAVADLKFPMLVYRTGAYAPNGIPNADGFVDYYKMINQGMVVLVVKKLFTLNVKPDIKHK